MYIATYAYIGSLGPASMLFTHFVIRSFYQKAHCYYMVFIFIIM
uniref:Uncharacterized protein n=1 Tax=Lepeophtheirus salmonis TaxID=72036 RepID=A0A0K2TII6_LEPSM